MLHVMMQQIFNQLESFLKGFQEWISKNSVKEGMKPLIEFVNIIKSLKTMKVNYIIYKKLNGNQKWFIAIF